MSKISSKTKESILLKAMNRGSASLDTIAKSSNISRSTLNKWLRNYRNNTAINQTKQATTGATDDRIKQLNHLLETHGLDEALLGEYCRKHGLYSHQLTQWRKSLVSPEMNQVKQEQAADIKKLKEENKRLQHELNYKEKALAEASALLIMKKKASLIWGGIEED